MAQAAVVAHEKPRELAGDFWGGLAAMLVALPSAIAFGVTIFSPLGASYAAQGAMAGIIGATAIGLVAAACGGTQRLISAPCAPAAAVMAAFALEASRQGLAPQSILFLMMLLGLLCGAVQILFGVIGLGRLIKYMPYPVVSGYLSGVGLIIILSQVPRFLGVPKGSQLSEALISPAMWNWNGIMVGLATIVVMVIAPKLTKALPPAILGLSAGVITYFLLGLRDRSLLTLADNSLVVGALGGSGAGFWESIAGRWKSFGVGAADWKMLVTPALTLAVLLSIDTLKTCLIVDTLTRSRHNSNRELVGQGLANLASGFCGGIPGAGTMGASLVNISSGGMTKRSGLFEGGFALVAFLLLGGLVAWVPIAALAAILILVGFRMIDRNSVHLLRSRSTILDFVVIVAVVIVAETVSLIAASAVGIGLAILLFIREQVGGVVVRRKTYGNVMTSKQIRLPDEAAILERRGAGTVIFELQGSLFFGTTDRLYTELEPEVKVRDYIILDMRRVQSVDITAVHLIEQIEGMLAERNAMLIFSDLPHSLPSGRDLHEYFDHVGLAHPTSRVKVFEILDEALEWVENRLFEQEYVERHSERPLELEEISLFRGRKQDTLDDLKGCIESRSFTAGQNVFVSGDQGDELFLIRRGEVRIILPLAGQQYHHLATFGRGAFFGEMAFLDHAPRSANAVALTDLDVFVLSRERFDVLTASHKKLGMAVMDGLARELAIRLRHTSAELRALQES